jgi:AI-2 transport protein TqsA
VINLVSGTLRGIAWTLSNAFLILIIMVFMLAETAAFPAKLRSVLGRHDADLSRFAKITHEVQQYLGIKTVVSLVTGVLVGSWTWILGLDFPLFWGLLAFLFNYIPSVGSILASIPPVLLGLIQYGLGTSLLVGLGYLVVNVTLGNLIEPNLMGRRLGLSTLVVILSLVFWGWVWGPVGMLLSLPMTMIVKIMLENTPDMHWIAILLGKSAPETPPPAPP